MSDERKLIKCAKRGDVAAFEQLIANYQVYCYNIARGLLTVPEDAQDVSQEALIKVFQKLNSFNEQANFATWLYRIVVNSCLDHIKKQNKLRAIDRRYRDQVATDEVSSAGVEGQVIKRQLADIVKRSIRQLPLKQRLPLVLRDYLDLSYDEVAATLQLPLGTVKSRLLRGRQKLRDIVQSDAAFSSSLLTMEGEE